MSLDWKLGGLLLGLVFFAAMALVKPIGVSTQFVIADGLLWQAFVDPGVIAAGAEGASSPIAYFDKYAGHIADPLNYGFVFVIALAAGAGLSSVLRGGVKGREMLVPALWAETRGGMISRLSAAFVGGFIVLFGARLAGGCTSGHMMSGMSQTALSGYIFALGAFATAVPLARKLYGGKG
ncbi:YeeE/YedE thiosulfate transporter family protein [Phaeovulum vinaykumarii]|uniref:Uncharacterized protein n=1 Tax=Phaeovulum vinaykumarii TaxID=407234 RepID=A0A1N7M0Y7_9RHOB|nr:YeeE/YedE thiosulfate transporter family protein [Phaeovulum vinaykumarii]SIS79748.1 hypothetical protein SAMN05421795_10536 [Phaeovulum vinaykumarii]SOC09604.1 hypothetical protein SAMN05878426_105166 [Phaeovulum vinaykumarii]